MNSNWSRSLIKGKKLIVLGWGPDCRMIAKVLTQENIECELMILNYNRPPNSLTAYLDDLARAGVDTELRLQIFNLFQWCLFCSSSSIPSLLLLCSSSIPFSLVLFLLRNEGSLETRKRGEARGDGSGTQFRCSKSSDVRGSESKQRFDGPHRGANALPDRIPRGPLLLRMLYRKCLRAILMFIIILSGCCTSPLFV